MKQMKTIEELRNKCRDKFIETNDPKYQLIGKILMDNNCFFIIDMDVAIDMLESLDVNNPLAVYQELISPEEVEDKKIKIID